MKLKELLSGVYDQPLKEEFSEIEIKNIASDSRNVIKESIFMALVGMKYNGADFIPNAIKNGASVIVSDINQEINFKDNNICFLRVPDTKEFLLEISQRFYDYPSEKVKTIGITGTNGKTTISYLLESILSCAKKRCGVIGTVNYRIGKKVAQSKNTTPSLIENQQFLANMVKENIEYCIMEVSSHALDQDRVDAINFLSAIFTNLTQDHLDYHKSTEDYFLAKSRLFTRLSDKANAIINLDDSYGQKLKCMTKANVITYGLESKADVIARDIRLGLSESNLLLEAQKKTLSIRTELIGQHNIYNILAAVTAALTQNIDLKAIVQGVERLKTVPGRLERINCGKNYYIFVDYAHTDDALRNVLRSLKKISAARIILVFGCGGDRDKEKRKKMGNVADELADFTVLTNDNPRSEDPASIIEQIKQGFKKTNYTVIADRKRAIYHALSLTKDNDVVLIAGKGHEDYQIFRDKTIHFDDREVVRDYLNAKS